jgi:hypothetical protein
MRCIGIMVAVPLCYFSDERGHLARDHNSGFLGWDQALSVVKKGFREWYLIWYMQTPADGLIMLY